MARNGENAAAFLTISAAARPSSSLFILLWSGWAVASTQTHKPTLQTDTFDTSSDSILRVGHWQIDTTCLISSSNYVACKFTEVYTKQAFHVCACVRLSCMRVRWMKNESIKHACRSQHVFLVSFAPAELVSTFFVVVVVVVRNDVPFAQFWEV